MAAANSKLAEARKMLQDFVKLMDELKTKARAQMEVIYLVEINEHVFLYFCNSGGMLFSDYFLIPFVCACLAIPYSSVLMYLSISYDIALIATDC